jgi:hypothetical protein
MEYDITDCALATLGKGTSSSVSGTTLTIGGTVTGKFGIGDIISGSGVTAGAQITQFGSGTGGAGTYTVTPSMGATGTIAITATASTIHFLDPANAGGTGLSAHRRVRSTPRLSITTITLSGSTATATTAVAHGLSGTQNLTITGALNDDYGNVSKHYNGAYSCDCTVATNQFSYTVSILPTPPPSPATGTITYCYWQVIG